MRVVASRIERKLNELDGVTSSVNYATEKAAVEFDPGQVTPGELIAAVKATGYETMLPVSPQAAADATVQVAAEDERDPTRALHQRLIGAVLLSLPLLVISMVTVLQFRYWQWLALELATPVVFWAGWPFHQAAWQNLRHATATMDTLISVGTLAAWGWSVVALFFLGAGMPGMHMGFDLVLSRGRHEPHLLGGRGCRDHADSRRPLFRGARQAPRRRRAVGAGRKTDRR